MDDAFGRWAGTIWSSHGRQQHCLIFIHCLHFILSAMWINIHPVRDLCSQIHTHTHRENSCNPEINLVLTHCYTNVLVHWFFHWDKKGKGQILLRTVMARRKHFPTLKFYPWLRDQVIFWYYKNIWAHLPGLQAEEEIHF